MRSSEWLRGRSLTPPRIPHYVRLTLPPPSVNNNTMAFCALTTPPTRTQTHTHTQGHSSGFMQEYAQALVVKTSYFSSVMITFELTSCLGGFSFCTRGSKQQQGFWFPVKVEPAADCSSRCSPVAANICLLLAVTSNSGKAASFQDTSPAPAGR